MRNRALMLGVILLILAVGAWMTDRTQVIYSGNLTLDTTAVQHHDMLVLSGNVELLAGAQIDGTLLVVCCNVMFDGEVAGDLYLLSGNLMLGPQAVVAGEIGTLTVNANLHPQAVVAGQRVGVGMELMLLRTFVLPPVLAFSGLIMLGVGLLRRRAVPAMVS
jgi:formylmethanofuran dehydrogenase subunit C